MRVEITFLNTLLNYSISSEFSFAFFRGLVADANKAVDVKVALQALMK